MFDNKYSKVLTVILIIVIILVIALLVYMGIDAFNGYKIDKETSEALGKFEDTLKNETNNNEIVVNDIVNGTTNEIVVDDIVSSETEQPNSNGGSGNSGGSSGNTVTYKGYEVIGMIEIPATNIKYPILNQVSIRSLEASIGYIYGAPLNEVGNAILVGHNYRNGTFFSNNKRLKNGDKIYITDSSGRKVTYVVDKKYETSTTDFAYATRDTGGKRAISLSTCTDDTKKRLIIWATEE